MRELVTVTVDPQLVKQALRKRKGPGSPPKHPVNQAFDDRTGSERLADQLAAGMGSWTFLIIQTTLMVAWVAINVVWLLNRGWDPYPFILLNLMLSLQATYAGPIVLLAGNRQSARDRLTLEHAAIEADKGGAAVEQILQEIRRNTKLTLGILEHLESETS